MTSASPYTIMRAAAPMQCRPVVQAVTIDRLGPRMPYLIDRLPEIILMIEAGTKNGEIRRGPRLSYSSLVSSISGRPPIPEPMMTPMRSAFSSVTTMPESCTDCMQSVQDSGIVVTEENADRIGVIIGSGIGGLPLIEETKEEYDKRGPRRISPFFVPASIINMISGNLSIKYGMRGPNLSIVTACTTGLHCIGAAARMIEYGDADVMVAGGAESTVSPLGLGGFASARALSTRNDDPATASRPWDKDRDGFVLGEDAGVMVLEEYEHAKARGAKIYAEVSGYGMSADAYHMTSPLEDGSGGSKSALAALANAGLNPDQIQYLNAHGTSTPLGDKA